MTLIIGGLLMGGALKGWADQLSQPTVRLIKVS